LVVLRAAQYFHRKVDESTGFAKDISTLSQKI